MGIFKKVVDTTLEAALLPVDLVRDKWTLGGKLTLRDEPYTISRVKKLAEHADGIVDEVKEVVQRKKTVDQADVKQIQSKSS